MLKTLITLTLFSASFAQQTIEMNSTPLKKNAVSFTLDHKIVDKEGFYEETFTSVTPSGKIFVYDFGNKVLFRYSAAGKLEHSFGSEGNGPGEFNQFVFGISASDDRVVVKNFQKVMIFKHDGTIVKEIPEFVLPRSTISFVGDNIEFQVPLWKKLAKLKRAIYTKDGELVKEIPNDSFDAAALQAQSQGQFTEKSLRENLNMPQVTVPFNGGYVQSYALEYKIDVFNRDLKHIKTLTREYDRTRVEDITDLMLRAQKRFYESGNEQQKKFWINLMTRINTMIGGYFPDIFSIIGSYKSHMFVYTSTNSDTDLTLDIITPDYKLLSSVVLKSPDEIISASVENGKLIVNQTNDEDGPFVKVYSIKM